MHTITNLSAGLAIYLASSIATNIKYRADNNVKDGPSTVEEWVDFCRPQLLGPVFEALDGDHPIALLDNGEGELNPEGITPLMRALVEAAIAGKARPILDVHHYWWKHYEDGDLESGVLVTDLGFFLAVHEAMANAKNAFYHHSDWFVAAVDVDDDLKSLFEQ